jgi:hypothetical protein
VKDLQRLLLHPFHVPVAADHCANINGGQFIDVEVKALKSVMTCPLIWATPKRWTFYNALVAVRARSRRKLNIEDGGPTGIQYDALLQVLWRCYNDHDILPAADHQSPVDAFIIATLMDMLAAATWRALLEKSQDPLQALTVFDWSNDRVSEICTSTPRVTMAAWLHRMKLSQTCLVDPSEAKMAQLAQLLPTWQEINSKDQYMRFEVDDVATNPRVSFQSGRSS